MALALRAGTKLALLTLMYESAHAVATVPALVVAPPEKPLGVLARVVLHNVVPMLLHNLLLSDRRLLVELWLFSSCLCSLLGKLVLIEQGALAFLRVSLLFPRRTTHVAELSSASAGCNRTVNFCWLKTESRGQLNLLIWLQP